MRDQSPANVGRRGRGASPLRNRGVSPGRKQQNAASVGLLVNVVRTLTTSANETEREVEKTRLETAYQDTDKNVDVLITAYKDDLSSYLQEFRRVSANLTSARERIRSLKNNLLSCKELLHCRRDELRKLWTESAEQRYVHAILERIDSVVVVPQDLNDSITKRHFLHVAQSLSGALNGLENGLSCVEGLNELRHDLQRRKDDIHRSILLELDNQLYLRPTERLIDALRSLRGGAAAVDLGASMGGSSSNDRLPMIGISVAARSLSESYLRRLEDDNPIIRDDGLAHEERSSSSNPADNPVQYIAILVDALDVMDVLPESIDHIRLGLQRGLLKVGQHTARVVYDHLGLGSRAVLPDSRYLAELLHLLFRQFQIVATSHHVLLSQLQRVQDRRDTLGVMSDPYAVDDIWNAIQSTIQLILNDYLDVKNQNAGMIMLTREQSPTALLSSYFVKKKPQKPKRSVLFRFEGSTCAMNEQSEKEKRMQNISKEYSVLASTVDAGGINETVFVCPPSPKNIVVAFKPLMKFVTEIESKMGQGGQACLLRSFVQEYVAEVFMNQMRSEIVIKRDMILQSSDAWSSLTNAEEMKRLDSSLPLLQSAVRMIEVCREMHSLMNHIPLFALDISAVWLDFLRCYHEAVYMTYEQMTRSVVRLAQDGSEIESRKISATWAVDEDISRLLKSLPNWLMLMEAQSARMSTPATPFSPPTQSAESTAEIRQRNQRESEILITNLGKQRKIEEWEIISDISQLKFLANLHESIEYFIVCVRHMLGELSAPIQNKLKESAFVGLTTNEQQQQGGGVKIDVVFLDLISKKLSFLEEFDAHLEALDMMSSTCLMILHLEVRVHCFHYLLPIARQQSQVHSGFSQEVDPLVLMLNRNLVQLDEALRANLSTRKVRYVFEGIGHLVAAIFINSATFFTKINETGKKRIARNMFAIQQCLSNITSLRESDLDHAQRYFELLNRSPDEILNSILEAGAEFTELEYRAMLSLAVRSHPVYSTEPGALDRRIDRLSEIMRGSNQKR